MTRLLSLVVLTGVLLLGALGAQAATDPLQLSLTSVGVEGSYFNLTMQPGETRQLTVNLANQGTEPVTARTFPADAYTLVNGGFGARLADEPVSGTTTWLSYQPEQLELAPQQPLSRTFTLAVPADAQPGEYQTSLVLQNATPVAVGSQGSGVGFNQVLRQVMAITIDVPGPQVPALAISDVNQKTTAGKTVVQFGLQNGGNVRLKPAGEFVLTTTDGAEVSRAPVQLDTVFAGTATTVEVPLAAQLHPGSYRASLQLTDAATTTHAEALLELRVPEAKAAASGAQQKAPAGAAVNQPATATQHASDQLRLAVLVTLLVGTMIALGGAWFLVRSRPSRRTQPQREGR